MAPFQRSEIYSEEGCQSLRSDERDRIMNNWPKVVIIVLNWNGWQGEMVMGVSSDK